MFVKILLNSPFSARVAAPPNAPGKPEFAPGRTLWYAQYDLDRRTLTVKFYLGEKTNPENENKVILEYSSPKVYELGKRQPPLRFFPCDIRSHHLINALQNLSRGKAGKR